MNYRKRHQFQHKVELSTLLKIVMAQKTSKHPVMLQNTAVNLASQLAAEAIALSKVCDTAAVTNNIKKKTVAAQTTAVY